MHILFYRYNNIFEQDVISAFRNYGLNITEERSAMDKALSGEEIIHLIGERLLEQNAKSAPFLFVFSINFFPTISEICEKLQMLYVCWSVDSPVMELFSVAIRNRCNRIFLFDQTQYDRFHPHNPDCIFYLPLATDEKRLSKTIETITEEESGRFSCDISFVGSLYKEYNPFHRITNLDDFTLGYIDGIVEAQMKVYGYNFIEDVLSDDMVSRIKQAPLSFDAGHFVEPFDKYTAAHCFIGMKLAEEERHRTLSRLSKKFSVDLYTRSDAGGLPDIHIKGPAHTTKDMPKIFHLSKINLNITMRPIQSGLSLRIFDILGCGGFLITNYQSEIPKLFEIGKDLEVYSSLDELEEKCAYYLAHEEERTAIAESGLRRIKELHTCRLRISELLSIVGRTI